MRGITASCLHLPLILLSLTGLAAAQNVSIQLTPITYPIVLPDSGGSFDYLLTVTNQGAPVTATVWCMATLSNGTSWGPVVGPVTQTLAAGQTQSVHRTQNVPPRAPYGYFSLRAYVGIYPDTVWAQDQFEFQHQAISGVEQELVARYNGPGNAYDEATSLAVDGGGNIYATGYSGGSGTDYDYATIKYGADGIQIWAARYNGPENWGDVAYSLALDATGNVYVTGCSFGIGTLSDYATIKYDANGNQLWAARYNGPGNSPDQAYSLALDAAGNVYVTGYIWESGTSDDYATIKYGANGNQIWVSRYDGPGNFVDRAASLALDAAGDVYVTGYSWGSGTSDDYATVKYDADGNQIWVARYNDPGNSSDFASSLAVDGSGDVYVTGGSQGSGTYSDYATIKYGTDGNQIWAARYDGPGNGLDEAYSIVVDVSGNVYVTGISDGQAGSGFNADYATIKYNSAGVEQWAARYNGAGNYDDCAYSIAVDGAGNVYVTGYSYGIGTSKDYVTIKYNSAGVQQWVSRYNGPGNYSDEASSLAVGGGSVYVTGRSLGRGTSFDYATIKYSGGEIANWMPVEATVLGQPLPQECRLEGNYPNPFNASTAFSYQLSANSFTRLRVYDTAGRLVETLVDGWRSAGTHELTWDATQMAAGMYFARLEAAEYVGVQKLILLK